MMELHSLCGGVHVTLITLPYAYWPPCLVFISTDSTRCAIHEGLTSCGHFWNRNEGMLGGCQPIMLPLS